VLFADKIAMAFARIQDWVTINQFILREMLMQHNRQADRLTNRQRKDSFQSAKKTLPGIYN